MKKGIVGWVWFMYRKMELSYWWEYGNYRVTMFPPVV